MAMVHVSLTEEEIRCLLSTLQVVFEDDDVLVDIFPQARERGVAKDAYDRLRFAHKGNRGMFNERKFR